MKLSENRHIHKNEKGFTLLDVLIATVVLSVGLLAIGIMQLSSISGDAQARELTEASTVAMDQLEELLARNYGSISTGTDQEIYDDGKYTVTIDVSENTDTTTSVTGLGVDVKLVLMTVTWKDDKGADKTFTMRHVIPMID